MSYLNITNDLSAKGRKRVKVGEVLMFDYEGSPVYLKIMQKGGGKVFAKRLDPEKFLLPEEADEKVMVVPKKLWYICIMNQEQKEARIQEIRILLVADENRPHGEERQKLLDELNELEQA